VIRPATDSPVDSVKDALHESERRFSAIVSSIPGLVFQMHMTADAQVVFTYVSEGCEALLGIPAAALLKDAHVLFSAMEEKSATHFKQKLQQSSKLHRRLDWEGKIWIAEWQDMKWVNIRATIQALGQGAVQWDGIMLNISQSKNEQHEIVQAGKNLQALTAHLNQVKEQERVSIAREIHDDLGGNMTAIKLGLSTIVQQIESGKPVSMEQATMLQGIVNQTFDSVHRISGNLRPNILDLGIVDALEWQVTQFRQQLGMKAKFITNCHDLECDNDKSMALFRICQEALSNIAKYAQADEVYVELHLIEDDLLMTVADNGIGIAPADKIKPNSFGLRGMQERAAAFGGECYIEAPATGTGTLIRVQAPVRHSSS
jgi:two-component system, NarL family, sensor histidine kinase UhpB